jgi:hypothetical protein
LIRPTHGFFFGNHSSLPCSGAWGCSHAVLETAGMDSPNGQASVISRQVVGNTAHSTRRTYVMAVERWAEMLPFLWE